MNASAVICADMASGRQHRRCSAIARTFVERPESLFMMRHLFVMHAIIRAMNKFGNDAKSCTIADALAMTGDDVSRSQFMQSLRTYSRRAGRRSYTGKMFEVKNDKIKMTTESWKAFVEDNEVAALRIFNKLHQQFPQLDQSILYDWVTDHQLASERLSVKLKLTTWRQFAILFYLSYRHHLGDQFVPLADVANQLDVDSKRVTLAIEQMFVDTAKQICKRQSVNDERVTELSLTDRLRDRIDEFHAQFDGFFPKNLTLSMFEEKTLKVASFHSQTKFDEVSFSSNYMDSLA